MKNKFIAACLVAVVGALFITTPVLAAGMKLPGGNKIEDAGEKGNPAENDETADKKKDKKKIAINVITKTEYKIDTEKSSKIKNEGKVYVDAVVDETTKAEIGLNYETKTDYSKNSESNKWEMENVWLEKEMTSDLSVRFGRQTYHLAKGLWLDQDGIFGGRALYKLDKNNTAEVFIGRDSQDDTQPTRLLEVLNFAHKFNGGSALGAFGGLQGTSNKFWGSYGTLMIAKNLAFNYEYEKNTFNQKHGYVADLKIGDTHKVGAWHYGIHYMDADAKLFEDNKYTDYDTQYNPKYGFKGPGVSIAKKMTAASSIELQRWWGSKKVGEGSLPVTKLTMVIKF